jgi:hypothetical protein
MGLIRSPTGGPSRLRKSDPGERFELLLGVFVEGLGARADK